MLEKNLLPTTGIEPVLISRAVRRLVTVLTELIPSLEITESKYEFLVFSKARNPSDQI